MLHRLSLAGRLDDIALIEGDCGIHGGLTLSLWNQYTENRLLAEVSRASGLVLAARFGHPGMDPGAVESAARELVVALSGTIPYYGEASGGSGSDDLEAAVRRYEERIRAMLKE